MQVILINSVFVFWKDHLSSLYFLRGENFNTLRISSKKNPEILRELEDQIPNNRADYPQ